MEKTQQFLFKLIKSNKPNRKDTTTNQYVRSNIKVLNGIDYKDKDKLNNIDFVNDTETIDKYINTLTTISTKRNLYTAILSLMKVNEDDKIYTHYKKKEKEGNDKQMKLYEEDNMNEKKTEKYNSITTTDIKNMLNQLLKDKDIENYILISLFYHYGYRNEISGLQYIPLKDFKRLTTNQTKDNNYLVEGSKIFKIVRYRFKTDKKYGKIENDITDKKLRNVMKKYVKTLNTDYLFTKNNKHLTNQQITDRLRYITKKYMKVDISSSMIYKINLDQYRKTNEILKEKARVRGHSQSTQSLVYIKNQ